MIYNLKFMFLFTVILNPNSPGWNMDVCLQPLIDELTELLSSRALTYDVLTKQNFLIGYILTNSIHLSHLLLLFLLVCYTHDLQLEVHVFIYGHTQS
jgi:hypothetical protein